VWLAGEGPPLRRTSLDGSMAMERLQPSDFDCHALIRLREQLQAQRPHSPFAWLRRRFELQQIEALIDWEDDPTGRQETAIYRRAILYPNYCLVTLAALQALVFSHRALTVVRFATVLGSFGLLALALTGLFYLWLPAMRRGTLRTYRRLLARARALPPEDSSAPAGRLDAAV
jgi:hypothetical protein